VRQSQASPPEEAVVRRRRRPSSDAQQVARIERSEIRDRSPALMRAPDFTAFNPGYAC